MMIGPAPITRMEEMSLRLGTRSGGAENVLAEALEQIGAVHRTRRSLRMVLDREYRAIPQPDALDRAVEQRAVGDLDLFGQPVVGDREAMILAGDLDLAGGQVLDRVVGA